MIYYKQTKNFGNEVHRTENDNFVLSVWEK